MNPEVEATQNRQTVIVRSLWRGVVDSLRYVIYVNSAIERDSEKYFFFYILATF